jgi:hypothetical protein
MACATPSSGSAHPDPVNTIAAAREVGLARLVQ